MKAKNNVHKVNVLTELKLFQQLPLPKITEYSKVDHRGDGSLI